MLAAPGGDPFCVIEPGNRFLAGCGRLRELACEGIRRVGVFWSQVLAWPLVWDQDGETAVQSPQGGAELAWGGPPAAEVDRLVAHGAVRRDGGGDGVVLLADPDGVVFRLSPG